MSTQPAIVAPPLPQPAPAREEFLPVLPSCPEPLPARRKIGLDAVRSAAIGLVLISHFAKGLDFLGVPGVELFFALSGFLIGGILYRRLATAPRWSYAEVKTFWLRRWWRTLPNYFLFLAVYVVFQAWVGGWPGLVGFLPFLVFCQDLLSVRSWFFSVSWSLCVEEWFYLLFPAGILFFTALRCSKRNAFVCTTVSSSSYRRWSASGCSSGTIPRSCT